MKILIATESYYPNVSGVAVFAHNLAQQMVKNGHQVFVVAPSPKLTEFTESIDGVRIFRLPSKINHFRKGYYISRWPFLKVKKIIWQIHPDVIHLQDPALISLAVLKKARQMKIPVVVTNHFSLEYLVSYLPRLKIFHPIILFFISRYLNWFYNQCQILTCPTETVAKKFYGPITKVKLKVISNGVDLSRFMPYYGDTLLVRRRFRLPKVPIVLSIGRIDVDKDIATLIGAIPRVLKETRAHFVIVGDGKEKEKLKDLSRQLKIGESVTFVDFIPHDSRLLPKIYQMADLFVNPCPSETQSIVVLEAQATALPVVGASSGALPELIQDKKSGFLFEPGNATDLAWKIVKILKDKSLAQKMGQRGLEELESHLVVKTHDRFEKIYKDLIKND